MPDSIPAELGAYRHTIDNLDAALIHILAERFRCTQQVGVLKAERGLPASDPAREERQIARLREHGVEVHLVDNALTALRLLGVAYVPE